MLRTLCTFLACLSSSALLLPQSWCCWLIPVSCCQQKVVVQADSSKSCCCCHRSNQPNPLPQKKGTCPKHGACANSLQDTLKPIIPNWADGFDGLGYLLPSVLIFSGNASTQIDQTFSERIHPPALHVQQCVWRC